MGAAFDEAIAEEAQNTSREKLNDEEKMKEKLKSVKSVKALVGRIKLVKVFGRMKKGEKKGGKEKGEEKTKEKDEKAGEKAKEKKEKKEKGKGKEMKIVEPPIINVSQAPEREPTQAPVQPPVTELAPKGKDAVTQTEPAKLQTVKEESVQTRPQSDHEHRTSRSSGSSSSSSSSTQSKSGIAKVLAALKNVFAKLGCHGDSGIEK